MALYVESEVRDMSQQGGKEPESTAADPGQIEELKKLVPGGFLRAKDPAAIPWHFAYWRKKWSHAQFGEPRARGPLGPLKHMAKEVQEALAKPGDVEEYADLLHLLLDASDRAGFTFADVLAAAVKKLEKNIMREWPKTVGDEPTEHVRG